MSYKDIAEKYDCEPGTIYSYLRKFNIILREQSPAEIYHTPNCHRRKRRERFQMRISKSLLYRLYVVEKHSLGYLVRFLPMNYDILVNKLKEFNIHIRTRDEILKITGEKMSGENNHFYKVFGEKHPL